MYVYVYIHHIYTYVYTFMYIVYIYLYVHIYYLQHTQYQAEWGFQAHFYKALSTCSKVVCICVLVPERKQEFCVLSKLLTFICYRFSACACVYRCDKNRGVSKKTGFSPWLSAAAMQRLLPQPVAAAGTAAMQPQQVII